MAFDYCTARGNFGDTQQPVRRVNHFKKSASQAKFATSQSPKRGESKTQKKSQKVDSPSNRQSATNVSNRSAANLDL